MSQVIQDMPFADYLALDAMSAHGLMQIERSPAHYRHAIDTPHAPTPAQALGTAAHMAILEPDHYDKHAFVAPDVDRRTKAGKAADQEFRDWVAEDPDALVITEDQAIKVLGMGRAVRSQPFARALLADGQAETTLLFEREGVQCKARPDWLCNGHDVILDLKTAADASYDGFQRAAGNWKYHLQNSWYIDAVETVGLGLRRFIFLVVESEPPHGVALYELDAEAIHAGRIRCERALSRYIECNQTGEWPGYPREIQPLSLSKWSL
jgi:exodeoxyribonuclease VIII